MVQTSETPRDPERRTAVPGAQRAPASRHGRTWFLAIGGLLVVLGLLAFAFPILSTFATTVFLAWLLAIAGIGQIVHAFGMRRWSGAVWSAIAGLAWLAGGLVALVWPLVGTVSFTLAIATVFIVQGLVELFGTGQSGGDYGGGWRIFSGLIGIAAGVLIALGLPSTSLWALGILAGANFIAVGVAYIAIGWRATARRERAAVR